MDTGKDKLKGNDTLPLERKRASGGRGREVTAPEFSKDLVVGKR